MPYLSHSSRRENAVDLAESLGREVNFLGMANGRPYGGIGNVSNFTLTRKSLILDGHYLLLLRVF